MGYIAIGLMWCWWLEWFTTKNLELPWIWRERFFHTLFWPFSLCVFMVEFFRNIK